MWFCFSELSISPYSGAPFLFYIKESPKEISKSKQIDSAIIKAVFLFNWGAASIAEKVLSLHTINIISHVYTRNDMPMPIKSRQDLTMERVKS